MPGEPFLKSSCRTLCGDASTRINRRHDCDTSITADSPCDKTDRGKSGGAPPGLDILALQKLFDYSLIIGENKFSSGSTDKSIDPVLTLNSKQLEGTGVAVKSLRRFLLDQKHVVPLGAGQSFPTEIVPIVTLLGLLNRGGSYDRSTSNAHHASDLQASIMFLGWCTFMYPVQ